ncbi:hypothetical protein GCM10007301_11160 [Azorhizobium oxalatiphilum]|uniref:Transmembrane protein n=1 Tax=Azorhizobium oxalatiphilum TaxID=980631 RepID=A0A917BP46_9HYPH|nr:hypothetical protein [Azorhizobium oxalatiphilum]GGF53486.1 hypothetical protein GCM10007301_11160 [Azorhizobium oxalatiphilum]
MSARDLSMSRIFAIPTLLAVLTAIGLLAGLLGEGPWKWVCWAGVGIPAAVLLWYVWRADR